MPFVGTFERRMRYTPTLPSKRNRSVQWHGNPNQKKMKVLSRERLNTKTGTLTSQDARLLCDKRMAYAAVGGGLDTEPEIRFLDRKDSIQKRAPWLCRMPDCHATSAWPMLRSEGGYTLNLRSDSPIGRVAYKNKHSDFAGCPIAMRQTHGLCCGRGGLNAESAIRLLGRKGSIQKRAP